jgi:hypothetical protein
MSRPSTIIVSRTRCGVLYAAPQSRDPLRRLYGPRTQRTANALRCVRGTSSTAEMPVGDIGHEIDEGPHLGRQ